MDIRKIDANDIKLLRQLDVVSSEIYLKYKEILQNNTSKKIKELKVLKEVEEEIEKELKNTNDYDLYTMIYSNRIPIESGSKPILSYDNPELNLHLYRPSTTLFKKFKLTKAYYDRISQGVIKDKNAEEYFKKLEIISIALDNESLSLYLSFLEDEIEKAPDSEFKKELLLKKYDVLFSVKDVENKYIESNFKIPKDIYIDSYLYAKLYNIPKDIYDDIMKEYIQTHFIKQSSRLINMDDSKFIDSSSYVELIDILVNMKICFMYLSDQEIKTAKEEIENALLTYSDRTIISTYVSNLFSEKNNIRSRHKVVE